MEEKEDYLMYFILISFFAIILAVKIFSYFLSKKLKSITIPFHQILYDCVLGLLIIYYELHLIGVINE